MKKGLLSILAGALLVVGCQNYDDQFESIENSINAINTQIAGLTQVQSEIQGLTTLVASLQSTVNSLPSSSEIATQLTDGLAGIISDVADLEAALDTVASSEEVTDLSDAVAESQTALDELLANSSVYQNSIIINSVATLDVYQKMGSSINIVNGSVKIEVSEAMDQTIVQEVVDNILVTLNDFTYTSKSSSIAETTFLNLTATASLTVEQAGGYDFRNLGSANNIVLGDAYKSSISVIHFGALTSVDKFSTEGVANTISFSKATELHLTSLPYYAPGDLTLLVDTGSVIDLTALDDVDSSGDQEDLTLSISGPSAVSLSNIDDGAITLSDVAAGTINGFVGTITIGADVESFTADSVVGTLSLAAATDLETLDITGVLDVDDEDDTGVALSIAAVNNNLETLTVAGDLASISIVGATKLTTATISADVDGAITLTNNDDLETLTLTSSEADSVSISGNDTIETLTVDTTNSEDDGSLVITDNLDLESLTVTYDAVETLTITGNTSLETVDLSGITAVGAAGEPVVKIYSNDLTASASVDDEDTTATADGAAATDLGEFTTASGLDTAEAYLALVADDADSSAAVFFDTVESYTDEAEDETTDIVFTTALLTAADTAQNATTVLLMVANTADLGDDAIAAKRSYLISGAGAAGDAVTIHANGTSWVVALTNDELTTSGQTQNSQALLATAPLAAADAAGVTLSVETHASPSVSLLIGANGSTMENSATTVAGSFATKVSDSFVITLEGANTATVTNTAHTAIIDLVNSLHAGWTAANSTTLANIWTVATTTTELVFTARDLGSSQTGHTLAFAANIASATLSNVGYRITNPVNNASNAATADNYARGDKMVLTFLADTEGTLLGEIGSPWLNNATSTAGNLSVVASAVTVTELSTTLNRSITNSGVITAANVYGADSRSDVVVPQDDIAAETPNDVFYTRVTWLD